MLRVLEEVNNDELKLDDDGEFSVSRNSRQTETEKTTNKRQIAKLRQARESQEERNSLSGDNGAVHCFYLAQSLSVVNFLSFELC